MLYHVRSDLNLTFGELKESIAERKREKTREKEREKIKIERKREKRREKERKDVQGQLLSICFQFSKRKTKCIGRNA